MEAGRPMVIGMTISGNSTVLRTGTTMKASVGGEGLASRAATGSAMEASVMAFGLKQACAG